MFDNGKQNQQFAGRSVDRAHLCAGGGAGSKRHNGVVRLRRICNLALAYIGYQCICDLGIADSETNIPVKSDIQTSKNKGRKSDLLSIVGHYKGGSRPCRPFFNIG